ncbi:hypothetical protein N8910_00620 [Candidatus Pelagibacter ubique]|nr:hypothetical protein [Candidatus Pelagibacter ubique]
MKKLLGIIILGLLLSGNAYSKNINDYCYIFPINNWATDGIYDPKKNKNSDFEGGSDNCEETARYWDARVVDYKTFISLRLQANIRYNNSVEAKNNLNQFYQFWIGKHLDPKLIDDVILSDPRLKIYQNVIKYRAEEIRIAKEKQNAEEKRIAKQKKIAKKQKIDNEKRIKEEKRLKDEEEKKKKYRLLVNKYGESCKSHIFASPEFNNCLKETETEDLLQAKLQKEFLESLTPEERRAYTCKETFGFKKGSSNFKDCIFKLYATELELEKLNLEKQLALAQVEAEKAKAATARAQVEIIQARSAAARAEGKLQEAQIQATKAQTLSMQQQAAASRQQAAAAQAQARAAQQQNSINLMTQGLKMLSGNQSSSSRLRTNCSWSSIGISCR